MRYHSITIGGTALLKHLIEAFSERDDPQCQYKVEHNLAEILVIATCGVIACGSELGGKFPTKWFWLTRGDSGRLLGMGS